MQFTHSAVPVFPVIVLLYRGQPTGTREEILQRMSNLHTEKVNEVEI